MNRLGSAFTALLIVMSLAACGGASEEQPTAVSNTQPTVEESAPSAQSSTLDQSYTSDGEMFPAGLSFQYPAGWVVSIPFNNIILVATSEDAANKTFTGSALDAGEAVIQLALNTRSGDEEVAAHISSFAGSIGIPLGDAAALTLGEHPAARVDGSNDARHLMAVAILFENAVNTAAGTGDTYVDALAYTNPGEFAQMEPTLLAILSSINFASE